MKVYGWMGILYGEDMRREFPDTDDWRRQTREICAAKSVAEVSRITGLKRSALQNISTTGNREEIEVATAEPGVVFWKPLDDRSGHWARRP